VTITPRFFLIALALFPVPAIAQVVPLAVGSIAVTPDGSTTATRQSNTGGYDEVFFVKNTYTTPITVTITCFGRVNVTCTGTDITQITLAPGAQIDLLASYTVGAAGTGRLVVKAASGGLQDTGYVFVPVDNPAAPVVALRNHNGDNRDRSLCLTAGAGEAAAWQCGDLLVAHGLPGYATMGRERALTLLYNSAQAVPKPVVTAAVTQGALAPGAVFVRLSINGTPKDSATYTGWASGTRQIAIPHDAGADSSGIYAFTLLVRNIFVGSVLDATVSDTLIVVNRASSLYGAGWSLAGVEELRLNQPGSKVLWVGGDGSAKVYRSVGTDTYVGAAGGFRDTLVRFDSAGVSWWRRRLRHRVSVTYSDTGSAGRAKHMRTTNRVGQSTVFAWSKDTLKSIAVPPGISGTTYTLAYASGRLDKITDPAGRILDVTIASNRLTKIIDPDNAAYHTDFSYDAAGRMTGRTNRRGFTNRYGYANGLRVTADSVRLDTAAVTYGITTFTPWDERGLAVAPSGNTAVDTALAYTKIDGPRAAAVGDTAEFWVDRWGAPVRGRDPLGNETTVTRGDAANPALATRARTPDGRIVGAAYDAPRARLLWIADSTFEGTGTLQTVTTRFVYGQGSVPDSPTEVRTPVDTTKFAYDTALGLPDSVIAPGGHRTNFIYLTSGALKGRLQSVIERAVRVVDTVAWTRSLADLATAVLYDAWGNDSILTTPKGAQTTYEYDAYRRAVRVRDPLNHLVEYAYDPLNRPTSAAAYDPGAFTTLYSYNKVGAVDSVMDPRHVKRKWTYDAAGRPSAMRDDLGVTETPYFGPSGLVDSVRTRMGEVIRHRFDAAGQETALIYPAHPNLFSLPQGVHDYTVPGDSLAWTYDAVGRPLTVNSARSTVTLTYNKEGSTRSERQVVRNAAGQVTSDLTMRYWYDVGGRRTTVFNGTDTTFYTYGSDARLAKIKMQWIGISQPADSFFFFWDGLGRRDSIVYTNQAHVSFGYDRDGVLRAVCSRHLAPNPLGVDYLEQRVRYEVVNADGMPVTFRRNGGWLNGTATCSQLPSTVIELVSSYAYNARHFVVQAPGNTYNDTYAYDSSGNRVSHWRGTTQQDSLEYVPGSNRLARSRGLQTPGAWVSFSHDSVGSRKKEVGPNPYPSEPTRLYYYNSLGQMTGTKLYTGGNWTGGALWCLYDALGRRVYACDDGANMGVAAFDGDNVVRLASTWRYLQGPGIDDPLVGVYWNGGGWEKYYYLTDGRGRLLAFTDAAGSNRLSDVVFFQNGGNQDGSINRSNDYTNTRAETPTASGLSFYRNRYYDQNTGRWTQEDPIGLEGGLNLYTYAGNNPPMFTDPFGLKLCFLGEQGEVDELRRGTEDATNTIIVLDRRNCVVKWEARGREGFEELQDRFGEMVSSLIVFKVRFAGEGQNSHFLRETNTARVRRGDIGFPYEAGLGAFCPVGFTGQFTLGAMIAHELLGHGAGVVRQGRPYVDAIGLENLYHVARNQRTRCGARAQ
jgi:RHS repeat-associated protein